jgi:NADH dehydrogenase
MLQAQFMEWMPFKLMSRDNVRSMKLDSISGAALPFGVQASALEATAPAWLGRNARQRTAYAWRARAGR